MNTRIIYFGKNYNYLGSKVIDRNVDQPADRSDSANVMAVGVGAWKDGDFDEKPYMWFAIDPGSEFKENSMFHVMHVSRPWTWIPWAWGTIKHLLQYKTYLHTASTASVKEMSRNLCLALGITDEREISAISAGIYSKHVDMVSVDITSDRGPIGIPATFSKDVVTVLKVVEERIKEYLQYRHKLSCKLQENTYKLADFALAVNEKIEVGMTEDIILHDMLRICRRTLQKENHDIKRTIRNIDYYVNFLTTIRGYIINNTWCCYE